jgi:hypothetical protein
MAELSPHFVAVISKLLTRLTPVHHSKHPPQAIFRWRRSLKTNRRNGFRCRHEYCIKFFAEKASAGRAWDNALEAREVYICSMVCTYTSFGEQLLTCESNECKRCKVKCIRQEDDINCQRCSTMNVTCVVVPTATQNAKESNKKRDNNTTDK